MIVLFADQLKIGPESFVSFAVLCRWQTLRQLPRDSRDFPLELQFVHNGVTFCQLKSAQYLAALAPEQLPLPITTKKPEPN